MKKLVIDARESGTTTGRYVDKLVEYLYRLRPAYEIVVLVKKHRLAFMRELAPDFEVLECPHKEFTFAEQIGLYGQLRRLRPGLVHFPMAQQPILYRGKVVTTMNDLTSARFRNPAKNRLAFALKQQIYKWLNKRVARKSAALLTYTEFVKDDVVKFTGVKAGKITVTPLAADIIEDSPEPIKELSGKQFLLYVGRPMAHKNLERLVEAFAMLKARHPGLVLVLAGEKDANYRRLEAAARQEGVQGVIFTGFISEGRLRWLYENCAVYVFPSLSEGFGLPGLEAMAHGAPVVSSSATCLPEVYGQAAYYFDPLDTNSMADAVNEVLTDKDLRSRLIQAGRDQAKKYSWQRLAEQTLSVYGQAMAE